MVDTIAGGVHAGNYPATMRWLNPFCVVGIDVGGTKIGGAIVSYEARGRTPRVIGYRSLPTMAAEGGGAVLGRVSALAYDLVEEAGGLSCGPVVGVGVATAGRINGEDGSIAYANEIMPGWTGQPVGHDVASATGVPCAVLNDVQAHALGELRHGAAAGTQTCIMVAAGTGLGGSIITGGEVLMGAHGYAGELGHTLHPAAAGIRCACGSFSHLESVASGSGIEARYYDRTGIPLSGEEVAQRAAQGDQDARDVIELAGKSLGEAIGSWANMLDPELVVLSGSVCKAGSVWWDALREGVDAQLPEQMRELPIIMAMLDMNAPVVGAAERLIDILAD